ncbi:hypothetical protein C5B85_06575 [Pseudoclavibacter sp. AY1F1]|nr:hypothetical protein C5B85_06575 [Pseudoclavibacter sp. AY1F1]
MERQVSRSSSGSKTVDDSAGCGGVGVALVQYVDPCLSDTDEATCSAVQCSAVQCSAVQCQSAAQCAAQSCAALRHRGSPALSPG